MPGPHPFEADVARFCRERRLFRARERVVVAFSGGPDSTALLLALAAIPGLRLVAAHLDHGLRAGSREEARRARRFARSLRVPFRTRRARIPRRGNVEEASRKARYAFLATVAKAGKARKVAVGHHLGDRAETVLHRILQGATLGGLAGIPLRRPLPGAPGGEVVRPLFEQDRAAILGYLRDRGAAFSEDPTNLGGTNARARLRRRLLPAVLRDYPQAAGSLAHLSDLAREASEALDQTLRPDWRRERGGLSIARERFAGAGEEGARRLLAEGLRRLPHPRTAPPLAAVRRLVAALAAADGRSREVPVIDGVAAEVGPGRVRLRRARLRR